MSTEKQTTTFEDFEAEVARAKANEASFNANKPKLSERISQLTKLLEDIKALKPKINKLIEEKAIQEQAKAADVPESPVNKTTSTISEPTATTTGSVADENQQYLRKLEDDILAGKRPSFRSSLLKPFKFDEAYFEQNLADRESRLTQAYKKGDVLGLIGISNQRIHDSKGLSNLPDSINDYLTGKLSAWAETKTGAERDFVAQMELRRNFRKRKGKKGGGLARAAISVLFRNISNKVSTTVGRATAVVKDVTLGAVSRSKAWQSTVNATTKLKDKIIASKFGQSVGALSTTIKSATTTIGKAVNAVESVGKATSRFAKGAFRGATIGAASYIAFGGSLPAGIVVGSSAVLTSIATDFLENRSYKLGSPKNILNRLQDNFYIDPRFRTETGEINWKRVHGAQTHFNSKNPALAFKKVGQYLRVANTSLTWGSVGGAIGGVIALVVGGPTAMALGATLGMGTFAAAGIGWDRFSLSSKVAQSSGLVSVLKNLPTFEIMGKIQTNLWLGSQIDMIMKKYKGNVGKFLSDNYFGGDSNRSSFENLLNLSSNWLNLSFGIHGALSTGGTRALFQGLATATSKFATLSSKFANVVSKISKLNVASIGGSVAGSALSYALLTALGLPIGPGAIIGMTVAGIAGNIIAAILIPTGAGALLSGLIFFFTNTIIIPIGGLIGGAIDKATGKLIQGASMMFNTLSAIMNLLALIKGKFDVDNLIMAVIALIGLFQAFDKMGMFETAYQCVNDASCPDVNRDAGYGQAPTINFLDNYDLGLINNKDLSQIQKENLYAYLDKNSAQITRKFPEKRVVLNLMDDTSFETPEMVILGLDSVHTLTEEDIANQISLQLESWSSSKILSEEYFN